MGKKDDVDRHDEGAEHRYELIPLDHITVDPNQPRKRFDETKLAALAQSIKSEGLLHPIAVKPSATHENDGTYVIVAGERRLRAFQILKRKKIPAVIRPAGDTFVLSIVENIQRADLDPIEEAHAVKRLIKEMNFTQDQVAERVGKSRGWVQQRLLLLCLPKEVQELVAEGKLPTVQALNLANYRGPKGTVVRLAHDLVASRLTGDRAIRAIRAVLGGETEGLLELGLMEGARPQEAKGEDPEEAAVRAEERVETVDRFSKLGDALRRVLKDLGYLENTLGRLEQVSAGELHDYFRALNDRTRGRLLLLAVGVTQGLGVLFDLAKKSGVGLVAADQYRELMEGVAAAAAGGKKGNGLRRAELDGEAVPEWLLAPWAMLLHPDGPSRSANELAVRTGINLDTLPAFLNGAFETIGQAWDGKGKGAKNKEAQRFCAALRSQFPGTDGLATLVRDVPEGNDPVTLEILG